VCRATDMLGSPRQRRGAELDAVLGALQDEEPAAVGGIVDNLVPGFSTPEDVLEEDCSFGFCEFFCCYGPPTVAVSTARPWGQTLGAWPGGICWR
jgi:hypothetical protein